MQLSVLRYFLETARLGSIRRAAEVLYVAPSAVSRQIAIQEQNFGAPLFERHSGGVRLTPAGEVFAVQARSTLRDFERLRSEIDDLQNLKRGVVRIATVEAVAAGLLGQAIETFTREYPGISFEVQVIGSVLTLAALAREECDIAIAFEPDPHKDVTEVQAIDDPIVAIMHPSHPLASRERIQMRELADHWIAMPDRTHVTRMLLDRVLAEEGLSIKPSLIFNQFALPIALARAGEAITFIPRLVARADVQSGLLKAVLIDHPLLLNTRFVLCQHRTRRPTVPARAFLLELRRQFDSLDGEVNGTHGRT
ncbi:MAG: LysR family transcriptional regulator [Novosphingobium sp.]|nr:LysR family transcriptional regulator [Novosphingobium sp.]